MVKFIKVLKVHKDGSETWEISYNEEFEEAVKAHYGKKRFYKKDGQEFLLNALKTYVAKKKRNPLQKMYDKIKKLLKWK